MGDGQLLRGGRVFLSDGRYHRRDLWIREGRVAAILEPGEEAGASEVREIPGRRVIPGLVDIHTHGAAGCDFSDASEEGLRKFAAFEASVGVTAFCPTSMTLPREELLSVFSSGERVAAEPRDGEARILGFHMEGPFLSPEKKGAQKEDSILLPDPELFRECQEAAGGRIRLVTLAPERAGAMDFIGAVEGETVVSLGHTAADYATAAEAFRRGASHMTHLWNAMPPLSHRAPGPIGAALDAPEVTVELISDGIHVADPLIRATFALFPGRVALISDSIRATGLSDGTCTLGGQTVQVSGPRATLADGTIAGSVTSLSDCLRHAVQAGVPEETAIAAATTIPAQSIGAGETAGTLAPGRNADLVVLGEDLMVEGVMIGGRWIPSSTAH